MLVAYYKPKPAISRFLGRNERGSNIWAPAQQNQRVHNCSIKKKNFAKNTKEGCSSAHAGYTLPSAYDAFKLQLDKACRQGDMLSKEAIERLALQMAANVNIVSKSKHAVKALLYACFFRLADRRRA